MEKRGKRKRFVFIIVFYLFPTIDPNDHGQYILVYARFHNVYRYSQRLTSKDQVPKPTAYEPECQYLRSTGLMYETQVLKIVSSNLTIL